MSDTDDPNETPALPPLGILELLMRVGEQHVKVQNLAASVSDMHLRKSGDVMVTFGTNQITGGDLLHIAGKPWNQLPMTGLVIWMPTALMQAAIRAHVEAHRPAIEQPPPDGVM